MTKRVNHFFVARWLHWILVPCLLGGSGRLLADKHKGAPEGVLGGIAVFSNGIYNLALNTAGGSVGRYTAGTGPSHPVTILTGSSQNVIYNGSISFPGTTFNSIRSFTSGTTYTFGSVAGAVNMDTCSPLVIPGPLGATITYFLATCGPLTDTLIVQFTALLHGTTSTDSTIEFTTVIINTGLTARSVGVRYMIDFQIGPDDGPTFQALNPNGVATFLEIGFVPPAFESYRMQNNQGSVVPLFNVLGTVTGPSSVSPTPTPPTELDYTRWPTAFSTAFDYTVVPGANADGDSAVITAVRLEVP